MVNESVEKIKLTDLNPAEYNPRKISDGELKKLTNSINEFGLVDPIIINCKNNKIIGGHQRYEVLLNQYKDNEFYPELNLIRFGDIGWVFTDTELTVKDESHEKALNLALNKISGEWDLDLLVPLLDELELSDIDVELTGFDDIELEEIDVDLYSEEESEDTQDTESDNVEEVYAGGLTDDDVTVKIGDVYLLGNHRLMCGDSNESKNIDILIDSNQIDLLLTDPPYGINIVNTDDTIGGGGNSDLNMVQFEHQVKQDSTEREHVTGTVGAPGIVQAKKYKPILNDDKPYDPQILLDLDIPSIIFGANNFSSRLPDSPRWLVWHKKVLDKQNNNNFSDVELAWTNMEGKTCKLYHYLWSGLLREGKRDLELKERVHPTQKPVGLLMNILNDFSEPNNNILDLFGGSGSTLIACEQTNRNCYMMELDPHYCQIIINRWEEFTGRKAEKIT